MMPQQKKKIKKSEEIVEQINKDRQEIQSKFDHWNKIIDEANSESDRAFQYAIVVKKDAIKDMGERLEKKPDLVKNKISTELIRGFAGRISSGYITATCHDLERGWTDAKYFKINQHGVRKKDRNNSQNQTQTGTDSKASMKEASADKKDKTVDELEFSSKYNMDDILKFWLSIDMARIIQIKDNSDKSVNWRTKLFEEKHENILNRWKQLGDAEVNITVNHNRLLIELLRYVNDMGVEEQRLRKRNEEMYGK